MRLHALILVLTLSSAAFAVEREVVPCKPWHHTETPTCCLKQNDTDLILYKGDEELKRYTYIRGVNLVTVDPSQDQTLKIALDTLIALRQAGACK